MLQAVTIFEIIPFILIEYVIKFIVVHVMMANDSLTKKRCDTKLVTKLSMRVEWN